MVGCMGDIQNACASVSQVKIEERKEPDAGKEKHFVYIYVGSTDIYIPIISSSSTPFHFVSVPKKNQYSVIRIFISYTVIPRHHITPHA